MPGFVCACLPVGRDYAVASGLLHTNRGVVGSVKTEPDEAGWMVPVEALRAMEGLAALVKK
jgi:hypothetical protein